MAAFNIELKALATEREARMATAPSPEQPLAASSLRPSSHGSTSGVHTIASLPNDDDGKLHRCLECDGVGTPNNPLVRCFYADKPQACRKAWHKFRCAGNMLSKNPKYVCCREHYPLFEASFPGTTYTCPDATDAALPPIPAAPP